MKVRQLSLGYGILMMVLGYLLFFIGVLLLNQWGVEMPKPLVIFIMIFAWVNVFVVIAGFTIFAEERVTRKLEEMSENGEL